MNSSKRKLLRYKWKKRYKSLICFYCHTITEDNLPERHPRKTTIDHFIPLSKGGSDKMNNLVIACLACNDAKKDNILMVNV